VWSSGDNVAETQFNCKVGARMSVYA
jgi:hypothetical protein